MKYREFWITNPEDKGNGIFETKPDFDFLDMYHVVEIQALRDLEARTAKLVEFLESISDISLEAREALAEYRKATE